MLNVKQAAQRLGLTTETLVALHQARLGPVAFIIPGRPFADCRHVRFRPEGVEAWRRAVKSHWSKWPK